MRPLLSCFLPFAFCLMTVSAPGLAQDSGQSPDQSNASKATAAETGKPAVKKSRAKTRRAAHRRAPRETAKERMERESKCAIKPVMTDAEIAYCRKVWRLDRAKK